MRNYFYFVSLSAFLVNLFISSVQAQPKSAIQFYDTTSTTPTVQFGWSGDPSTGHFFICNNNSSKSFSMMANGNITTDGNLNTEGTITAMGFVGDGSQLTGIPLSPGSVTTSILADSAVTSSKIKGGAITGSQINSNATLNISKVTTKSVNANDSVVTQNIKFPSAGSGNNGIYTTNTNANLRIDANSNLYLIIDEQSSGTGNLEVYKDGPSGIPYFMVNNNGNVGIGATPSGLLTVQAKADGEQLSLKTTFSGNAKIFEVTQESSDGYLYLRDASGRIRSKISGYAATPTFFMSNVSIGDSLSHTEKLYVAGGVVATNLSSPSDRHFKTDITPLDGALQKVKQLQGVSYNWKRDEYPERKFPEGKQIGLIAQDVEKVIPEVVHTDNDGYKSLSYDKLTAVLIEAVKEQQKIIEEQSEKINQQNTRIEKLETLVNGLK